VLLSRRARIDAEPNRLGRAIVARREAGRSVLDLTVSNPTRAALPYDRDAIAAAFGDRRALEHDPAPFGLPAARATVASLWRARGVAASEERVLLTASTSEAYAFLFKLLCDPGEQVLVPRPSYPLFEHLARYEGVEAVPYSLCYDGAWHLDASALRRAVTSRTRAVVVVSPNNPTGSFLGWDDLGALAELGLPVISDEVFGAYRLGDGRRVPSALAADGLLVFALDGLSKLAALPQAKLAWITVGGPDPLVAEALTGLELVMDTFLSPGAAVQHALPELLRATEPTRAAIVARARSNLSLMAAAVRDTPATLLPAEGGWYAVLRLPATRPEEDWVLGLLEARGVLVQPGYFYDFEDEPYLVISLLTPETDLERGMVELVDYVASEA
jgi:aspartate/methionine/tyrosine aminotransferase